MKRQILALVCAGALLAPALWAADAREAAADGAARAGVAQAAGGAEAQAAKPPSSETKAVPEAKVRRHEEVTVESASKSESTIIDAPATMTVVSAQTLASSPAQNYADLLRNVPGMNVIQMSARDLNLTTRQGTTTLNNSQLVLVDGRSVYLDFFDLVLWDFVPNPESGDIKQIEVVRGPASVVWGANALTGVVNIITKTPREHQGFGLNLGAGLFSRKGGSREGDGAGQLYNGNFSYASVVNDTWSYKLTAGYYNSDPYSRPVGTVPLACHPYGVNPCRDSNGNALPGGYPVGGAPYPADKSGLGSWPNNGTSQPKVTLRLDQELQGGAGGRITYEGGYAGTEGIIHTGIGPFDIQSDSYMAYGKAVYTKNALRIGAFGNFVDANAPNLLLSDPATGAPIVLAFKTQTYDVEVGNSNVLGGKHVLTYGANFRRNDFDITLAPGAPARNDFGAYVQEEFYVDKFRVAVGGRADKAGNLDHWFFSPRVSLMWKPTPDQSLRASYNRAFRAPSAINNYLDQDIFSPQPVDLRPLAPLAPPPLQPLIPQEPFYLIVNNFGNPDLTEEHVDAFELAYTGTIGRTSIGLAVYQNDTQDNINFTTLLPDSENPQGLPGLEYYTVDNPAQGVGATTGKLLVDPLTGKPGLSPFVMAALAQVPPAFGGPVRLPYKVATYLNLGPLRNRGFEASLQHRFNSQWTASGNYSYQADPKVLNPDPGQIRYPIAEIGVPPKNRFNAAVSYNGPRFLGNVNVNYVDKAFWNDVLSAPYFGFTDSYTLLNATLGVKFAQGKGQFSLRGTNLLNQEILQHIYGDVLRISVVAELRFFTR
jgi:outer membrane receptor protein involved in Fe transport